MENEKDIKNKSVETYAGDMARAIDGSEGQYIRRIISEQEQHDIEIDQSSLQNRRNRYFMIISIFLMICAVGALIFLAFFREQNGSVSVGAQFVPIIYLDNTDFKEIDGLNKDQIAQNVLNQINTTEIKPGGVLGVYLTYNKQLVGLRKFLTLISSNLDQGKITFVNDNFLIGATNIKSKNLFILLKMRSIVDVFDPIHVWENKMFNDLHGFFGVNLTSDTKYLLTKNFEDAIVQNKNARILRDNNGKIVMMYVFIDDTSMVITDNEASVREVLLRISAGIIRK